MSPDFTFTLAGKSTAQSWDDADEDMHVPSAFIENWRGYFNVISKPLAVPVCVSICSMSSVLQSTESEGSDAS